MGTRRGSLEFVERFVDRRQGTKAPASVGTFCTPAYISLIQCLPPMHETLASWDHATPRG